MFIQWRQKGSYQLCQTMLLLLTDYTKLCQKISQKIHRKCNYDRFNNWRMPKGFWGIQSPKKGRKVAIFKFGPISGWKRSFTVCNFKFCKLLTNTSPSPITAIPYGALTFPSKNLPMYSPVTEYNLILLLPPILISLRRETSDQKLPLKASKVVFCWRVRLSFTISCPNTEIVCSSCVRHIQTPPLLPLYHLKVSHFASISIFSRPHGMD